MKRIAVKFFRHGRVGCLWMWLALGSLQALAATSATNTARMAPPPGITDSVGGCDLATPPNCIGNNISTASIDVWATTASKTASPASGTAVLPGSLITYTVSVNVTGAATTADVQLTDTLSAGLSFGSVVANAGGFAVNTSSNPLSFTLPAGAAVGVHTVQYTARVAANATGSVSNSVVGSGCSAAAPCTTTHTIGALSLVKALESESGTQGGIAEPGESLVYTITLRNTSGTAASYNLTDTLGAGLSYVSSAPAGINAGQTTTWANLSVPADGSLVVRVNATVNAPITVPSVSNLAKPTGGPDPTCPSVGNCVVTPTASAVTVAKRANPASGSTIVAGQTISYTLTAVVTGGATTTPTVLSDTLGAGLSFGAVSSPGAFAAGGAGNTRTFTLPVDTPAGTYAVTYTATVNAGAVDGTVNNAVTGATCATPGGCGTSHPVGTVTLVKALVSESGTLAGIAEPGETLGYRITLTNPSAAPATYNLTDTMSPGLSYVSSSNGGVNAGQNITWTGLSVPAGGSLAVTVTATVNAPITVPSISNLAKPTGGPDPTCPSVGRCVVTPTASTVTVAKSANPASGSIVVAGQTIGYTLTATVTGGATTAPTVLTDTLGTGLSFGSVSAPGAFTAGGAGNTRTFTLPQGTAAGTYAVSYMATVNAGAVNGTVNNAVTGAPCTVVGGCTTNHQVGTVSLVKTLDSETGGTQPGVAEPGETLRYRLRLSNPSAVAASYNLTDTLGADLTYVSSAPAGVNAGQTTTWANLSVPPGGIDVFVTATVNAPITVSSVSNLAKPTGGPDPVCPSAGNCVVTPTASTVTVAKTANPVNGSIVVAGQSIAYTLTATVTGGATTAATVLRDTLGAGLSFNAVTVPGVFTAGGAGNNRSFTLPQGTAAGTYSVIYTAAVNAGAANGTVNNAVTGAPCTTTGVCTTNHPVGTVTLEKTLESETGGTQPGIAEPGETLRYRLRLSNPSTVAANYNLTDTLGAGLSYVSSAPAGVNSGQSTTWTALSVPAGSSLDVAVIATVNTPITVASVRNLAKPTGGPDPTCPGVGTCVVTPTASTVTVAKSANPVSGSTVIAGQSISYTLTVTVTGGATTVPSVLNDALGAGLTFGAVTSPGAFAAGGAGNNRSFTLPQGTAAGTYSVTYTATVNAGAANGAVNNAVTGATCAATGVCTTTHPVGNVTLEKTLESEAGGTQPGIAEPGETLRYRLRLTNPSTVAVNYNLTDTLGAGLSYVSSAPAGVNSGQSTTWTALGVPAGGALDVTVVATVNTPVTVTSVSNLAKPTGGPDPTCPSVGTCVVTPTAAKLAMVKSLVAESGSKPGLAEAGELLTYSITVTNTGGVPASNYNMSDVLGPGLSYVSSTNNGVNSGATTNWSDVTVPANGTVAVQVVARVDSPITTAMVRNIGKPTGGPDPTCPGTGCSELPTAPDVKALKLLTGESGKTSGVAEAGETLTYTITLGNTGGTAFTDYRFTENVPLGATLTGVAGASGFGGPVTGPASVPLVVPIVPAGESTAVTVVFKVADAIPAGVSELLNLINGGDIDPNCQAACSVTIPVEQPSQLSIVKSASVREARVGDLVRYTLRVTNIGASNVVNARITDTPPPGFSYVADSMSVADGDGAFVLGASQYPLQIGGIDVAIGRQAIVTYLLRVGAGVPRGDHVNQAQAANSVGRTISNVATAQVSVVADALVDESLIVGTVFDDRDGDGWQAPAGLSGVRVQGGFALGAYVPGSTQADRGQGLQPEPDASAPLLRGIAVGRIAGRQSEADPVENHQVVIRQRLTEPAFTGDFVLTSDQGITVRMDAAGNTSVEKTGDAAKGLNGAQPTVERRIARSESGYLVDYVIRNTGIDERGVPGVRIASVEGLLIETDPYGRYNLAGVLSGNANRGRNFILKVDPSTLPDGAEFTTPNPLVRRITPGLPARFDFGVKLPVEPMRGASEQIDIALGEVIFAPGSAELRAEYLPVVEKIAAKVNEYAGGELVIRADGEAEALAMGRVQAVERALQPLLSPAAAAAVRISARTELTQPVVSVVGVPQGQVVLGTVLFDTDKSEIKPQFRGLIAQLAKRLNERGGGVVGLVGHADRRASDAYNLALGLRRAGAVYEALAEQLNLEVRAKVRVETLNNAPAAVRASRK